MLWSSGEKILDTLNRYLSEYGKQEFHKNLKSILNDQARSKAASWLESCENLLDATSAFRADDFESSVVLDLNGDTITHGFHLAV